jgi:hypothetical protein
MPFLDSILSLAVNLNKPKTNGLLHEIVSVSQNLGQEVRDIRSGMKTKKNPENLTPKQSKKLEAVSLTAKALGLEAKRADYKDGIFEIAYFIGDAFIYGNLIDIDGNCYKIDYLVNPEDGKSSIVIIGNIKSENYAIPNFSVVLDGPFFKISFKIPSGSDLTIKIPKTPVTEKQFAPFIINPVPK